MKKNYLLFGILMLILTSCSKDNEISEADNNDLIGQWFVTAEIYDGEKQTLTSCDSGQYHQFTAEKEVYIKFVDTEEGCVYQTLKGTYEVNGNKLTLKDMQNADELIYNFDIIKLNTKDLIIETISSGYEGEEIYRVELEKR
jgi:hypothetical protein